MVDRKCEGEAPVVETRMVTEIERILREEGSKSAPGTFERDKRKTRSFFDVEAGGTGSKEPEILALSRYGAEVLLAGRLCNLVGNLSLEDLARDHILDALSLTVFEEIREGASVVDVGSGAGFPGVPLAIVRRDVEVTALEPRKKRAEFLSSIKEKLGLDNFRVLMLRAEEAGRHTGARESFNIAVARAVGTLSEVLEYCVPLVEVGGRVVLWRGKNWKEEMDEAKSVSRILGGTVSQVHAYGSVIQGSTFTRPAGDRGLMVICKVRETPAAYPRRVGVPRKRPLYKCRRQDLGGRNLDCLVDEGNDYEGD